LGVDAPKVDTQATRVAVDARTADDALYMQNTKRGSPRDSPADAPVATGCPDSPAINQQRLHFVDLDAGTALG
jgi:hypothetical protein